MEVDVNHPRHQTSPVQVEIKNWSDFDAKPPLVKKSTLKTWVIDPAGQPAGAGPANVQICDYEPKRIRTILQVLDYPVAVTAEVPVKTPDTNAVNAAVQGIVLPPSVSKQYVFFGPDPLWLNAIAAPAVAPTFPPALTGVVDTATAVFAAAAGGSLFGPAAGESVAMFALHFQSPAAAVNMDVTLTNVLGGPLTFRITVPVGGKDLFFNFPSPIPASSLVVFPTVNVPATVGGPAYSITLQSYKAQAQPVVTGATRVTVIREYC